MKTSKLFFVPSHHDFDKEGIEATQEMLDYGPYPFLNTSNKNLDYDVERVFKNALNALTQLGQFTVKASIIVDENKCLRVPKRIWAIIYLDGEVIYHITHDTRSDYPYGSILDWAQLMKSPLDNSYEGKDAEFKKVIEFSSEKNWVILFKKRLQEYANKNLEDAKEKMQQAYSTTTFSQKILNSLI